MYSRNDKDWTDQFQVIAAALAGLPVENAVLDGEVVVQLPDGRTSFQELQKALGAERAGGGWEGEGSEGGGSGSPLLYYVFDLLHLDGYDLTKAAIEDRQELLRRLLARVGRGGRILLSDHIAGGGGDVLDEACRAGTGGHREQAGRQPVSPGGPGQ